jgi:hypothetical protein
MMLAINKCSSPFLAAEEEHAWSDTLFEEAQVKLEVSELLWDDLMTEIAVELKELDCT